MLILQDTTEFSYKREHPELIGSTHKVASRKDKTGRSPMHTICGILMHSSLAITTQGVPLGLAAIKFWTRKKFKGCEALKRKINPTRVPIEEKESYLARANDSPPGNTVIWRGLRRLTDIQLGFELAKNCG